MLSKALQQVGGYFDRRLLVSVFFPSLVAWGAVAAVAVLSGNTPQQALDRWKALEAAGQAVLAVAFFAWVVFWTFLTANFRLGFIRFFEGYPPESGLFRLLRLPVAWAFWLSGRWEERKRRKAFAMPDALGPGLDSLKGEQYDYEKLLEELQPGAPAIPSPHPDADAAADAAKAYFQKSALPTANRLLWSLARVLGALAWLIGGEERRLRAELVSDRTRDGDMRLAAFCHEACALRRDLARWAVDPKVDPWSKKLDGLLRALGREVRRRVAVLGRRVEDTYYVAYAAYPPGDEPVMPTRLGNALRSAEAYAMARYGLDAVLFWPRLLPLLPKEFAAALDDVETALYLMIVVTTFVLLFGIPLASAVALWDVAGWAWWQRLLLFAGLLAGIAVFSRLTYLGAVAAAGGYGEKVRAAFDLYRFRVLKAMHLQRPLDLEQERAVWKEATHLIYYVVPPRRESLRYVKEEDALEPGATVPVPKAVAPAGQALAAGNLEQKQFDPGELPSGTVLSEDGLVKLVPLRDLPKGRPISAWDLAPGYAAPGPTPALAVRLPAAVLTALRLKPGDRATVTALPPAGGAAAKRYANLFVRDVRSGPEDGKMGTVVVAVCDADFDALAQAAAERRIVISR